MAHQKGLYSKSIVNAGYWARAAFSDSSLKQTAEMNGSNLAEDPLALIWELESLFV